MEKMRIVNFLKIYERTNMNADSSFVKDIQVFQRNT